MQSNDEIASWKRLRAYFSHNSQKPWDRQLANVGLLHLTYIGVQES